MGRGHHRHHARDARFLPLAVGADRAPRRRVCRPALLRQRPQGAAHAPHQYGRADLDRRDPRPRRVALRDRGLGGARLFRQRRHAPLLPARRADARPRHAAQDPRRRRQPRRAQIGDRREGPARRRQPHRAGRGAVAGRHHPGPAGRSHRGRRDRHCRRLRNRREPGQRRDAAADRAAGRYGLCRHAQSRRGADPRRFGSRRPYAGRRSAKLLDKATEARSRRVVLADRAAQLMRRWCT